MHHVRSYLATGVIGEGPRDERRGFPRERVRMHAFPAFLARSSPLLPATPRNTEGPVPGAATPGARGPLLWTMDGEKPCLGVGSMIWGSLTRPSLAIILLALALLGLSWLQTTTNVLAPLAATPVASVVDASSGPGPVPIPAAGPRSCSGFYWPQPPRRVVMSIADFGGMGDGETSNTEAFRRAVKHLGRVAGEGGAQLNVPRGRWVTGSFNLTSHFTLFLEEGAFILGSQDPKEWPVIEALPSYGRGRERPGGRHISLLHADGVSDVVITGQNGSIDGQGKMWWELWWNRTLQHTRGHLLELVNSQNILISNVTFLNSPFWTIHPVYCSNVVIKDVTVLAPLHSPNTDGIDPDSSTNVCIEDCYIESGDDLVAVKSGWDQYGMKVARPSSNIVVRRVSGTTPTCSGVGIGSEMSGGIRDIWVEDLHVWDSAAAVRVKTDRGRGGYISNITITNVTMERVKIPIRFSRGSNDHPDNAWNPKALPKVEGILISNVVGVDIQRAPLLEAVEGAAFKNICLRNVSLEGIAPPAEWHCEFVSGNAYEVFPSPCPQLRNSSSSWCFH